MFVTRRTGPWPGRRFVTPALPWLGIFLQKLCQHSHGIIHRISVMHGATLATITVLVIRLAPVPLPISVPSTLAVIPSCPCTGRTRKHYDNTKAAHSWHRSTLSTAQKPKQLQESEKQGHWQISFQAMRQNNMKCSNSLFPIKNKDLVMPLLDHPDRRKSTRRDRQARCHCSTGGRISSQRRKVQQSRLFTYEGCDPHSGGSLRTLTLSPRVHEAKSTRISNQASCISSSGRQSKGTVYTRSKRHAKQERQ